MPRPGIRVSKAHNSFIGLERLSDDELETIRADCLAHATAKRWTTQTEDFDYGDKKGVKVIHPKWFEWTRNLTSDIQRELLRATGT